MPDIDLVTKKNFKSKEYPWVINVLKELVEATIITKSYLDPRDSLTIGELLALAPTVEKQFTKAISKHESIHLRVSLVNVDNLTNLSNCWYSIGFLKIKIRPEDGFKVTAFVDIRVEINVKTREVIEDTRLTIKNVPRLELIFHIFHSQPCLGLCEDVEITISRLKTRHHIFVLEAEDYDLVLGHLFLNTLKFWQ